MADSPDDVTTVAGYRLGRAIGSDSIGLWFDAQQESLKRRVTVKVLKPHYESRENARKLFLAEMDRLAPLEHHNLVRVLDSRREGRLLLVTDHIGTRTLASELKQGRPLEEKVAVTYARCVASALEYLATQGLAYKNVTPRLVSIPSGESCRLITFRNVVPMERLIELRGKVIQDPHYIAPEQLAGTHPIGPAAASYQIASPLFHMLATHPPHEGESPIEIARGHLTKPFPSLRTRQPYLSDGVYDLLDAATSRDPARRLDLGRTRDALAALAVGEDPGLREPQKPTIQAPRPRRRRRR